MTYSFRHTGLDPVSRNKNGRYPFVIPDLIRYPEQTGTIEIDEILDRIRFRLAKPFWIPAKNMPE